MDQLATSIDDFALTAVGGDPLWFKDAIVYELHVKAFFDANNDGIGDFRGLAEKLDYIQALGVTAIWLLPFYPSPMLDDGYDVSDYHNIHAAYGTRHDFRHFVREAHRRGLRVITELVVNHTSDQHAWFQAARRAPKGSSKRDYYVWSDDPNRYAGTRIIFTDTESSNWAWDAVAQAHYWHRFFSHQPDLNFDNPRVLRAVIRTMQFWLEMGVDGFRLDAIPYLCEREGTNNENLPSTHAVIRQIRAELDRTHPDRVLLAEANQWPEDVREYFGNGDECHMAYHFPLMPRLFMAIAQEDRYPVVEIMRQTPEIPANCQWAIFLRNHDELTLEMVTDRERDYMYQTFANDPRMRINVGIRRRLAPLLENDRARMELMSFLLFTMPGSPILYYGDEIGMGDNIYLGDRNGVRTPMQWSPDRNAGFSRADPQRLYLPPNMDAAYGYEAVNVEAQARNPSSLLNWTRRIIETRKRFKAFGRGTLTFLDPGNRKVLAYLRKYDNETILCAANLAGTAQAVELDLSRFDGRVPVELVGRASFPPIGKLPYLLTLPGHGYYAFQLATDVPAPSWHEQRLPPQELPVLVMLEGWQTFLTPASGAVDVRRAMASRTHEQLEREVLLPHLETQRWYAAKDRPVTRVDMVEEGQWQTSEGSWLLTFLKVEFADADPQTYFLPLAIAWESRGHDPIDQIGGWAVARVRERAKTGVLYGAFGDAAFCRALAQAMGDNRDIPFGSGHLRCASTPAFAELASALAEEVRHPPMEQSNTGVFFGERLYLKGYRQLRPGINPEVEVGRFLTVAAPFKHVARVLGWIEYAAGPDDGRAPLMLAVLQEYVEHQGNLWDYTLNYLQRYVTSHTLPADPATAGPGAPKGEDLHRAFVAQSATLGRRIGELHAAFATTTGNPAFDPERVTPAASRRMAGGRARRRRPDARPARAAVGKPARCGHACGARAARLARAPARAGGRGGDRRRRSRQDALSRRSPPRPGAGGAERLRDHRFRGRTGAIGRGAPPQAFAPARRRRDDPLRRLRRAHRAFALRGRAHRRGRARRRGVARLAPGRDRRVSRRLPGRDSGARVGAARRRRDGAARAPLHAREGALRGPLRARQPSRLALCPGRGAARARRGGNRGNGDRGGGKRRGPMSNDRVLAMVLAGGEGTRLAPLTAVRSKPAVPFGARYRIIDFVLSNLVNSEIYSIYILVQYRSQPLIEHIRNAWVLAPILPHHFVTVVPPQMREGPEWFQGTADAVYQNLELLQVHAPALVRRVRRRPCLPHGCARHDRVPPRAARRRHRGRAAGAARAGARRSA